MKILKIFTIAIIMTSTIVSVSANANTACRPKYEGKKFIEVKLPGPVWGCFYEDNVSYGTRQPAKWISGLWHSVNGIDICGVRTGGTAESCVFRTLQ